MIYIVSFEIHRDCQIHFWVYYCTAKNAKAACAIARTAWATKSKRHMFHVHAVKSRVQDANLLEVTGWTGYSIHGADVIGTFMDTDFRTWRVDGRNLYGTTR